MAVFATPPPLSALIGQSSQNKLAYPLNLGSLEKNHYIIFNVFKTVTKADAAQLQTALNTTASNAATKDRGEILSVDNSGLSTAFNVKPGDTAFSQIANGNLPLNDQTAQPGIVRYNVSTTTVEATGEQIALYIPEEVNLNENAQYGEASFINALGDLSGGIIKKASSYIDKGGSALLRLGLNKFGYVFNPQEQLMFEGIDFRKFNMSFTFTPTSAEEAEAVRRIIEIFRKNAAPDIGGLYGFFFIPPSQFNIAYYSGGSANKFVHNFKRSVLEDVTVNYAPNGWSAHYDGSPVQTTLSLSFKELELVTSSDIAQGY